MTIKQTYSFLRTVLLFIGVMSFFSVSKAEDIKYYPLTAEEVLHGGIFVQGSLVRAFSYKDKLGLHWVIFSKTEKSTNPPKIDSYQLTVKSYLKQTSNKLSLFWDKSVEIDCSDLDSEARFLDKAFSITDLNKNSVYEVTFGYQTFCGGGVEPQDIYIQMYEGDKSFGIRGTTIIKMPGAESMGGEQEVSENLKLSQNSSLLKHLSSIWSNVVGK